MKKHGRSEKQHFLLLPRMVAVEVCDEIFTKLKLQWFKKVTKVTNHFADHSSHTHISNDLKEI